MHAGDSSETLRKLDGQNGEVKSHTAEPRLTELG